MKILFTLLLFITTFQQTHAQHSLDTLRLVLPVGHTDWVSSAIFSPDGKLVATASTDRTVGIYDVFSGKELQVLIGHESYVYYATFSPDGKLIATVSEDETARIWDVQTGMQKRILKDIHSERIQFSPDGNLLLTTGWLNIIVFNILTRNKKSLFIDSGRNKYLNSRIDLNVKFSSDGRYIMGFADNRNTAGSDQNPESIHIWEAKNGKKVSELVGHNSKIYSAEFSWNSKYVVSSGKDSTNRIWEITSGKELRKIRYTETYANYSLFSKDNNTIYTCNDDGTIRSFEFDSGKALNNYKIGTKELDKSILSPNGNFLLAKGSRVGTFMLNIQNQEIKKIPGSVLCISPNSKYFILYNENSVCLYNLNTSRIEKEFKGCAIGDYKTYDKKYVTFPLKNKIALSLDDDGYYLFDENLNGFIESFSDTSLSKPLMGVQSSLQNISPDGKFVVLTYGNNSAKIFNTETGKLFSTLIGHLASITSAVFSSDSKKVITTSFDATAMIWDINTGETLQTLDHSFLNEGEFEFPIVFKTSLSPDGQYAITETSLGTDRQKHWLREYHLWWLEFGLDIQTIVGAEDNNLENFSLNGMIAIRDTTTREFRLYQLSIIKNLLMEVQYPIEYVTNNRFVPFLLDASHISNRNRYGNSYEIIDISTMYTFVLPWKRKHHTHRIMRDNGMNYRFKHYLYGGITEFFSDNKKLLKTLGRSDDNGAQIWDTYSGTKLKTLDGGHTDYICDAAVCPDGSHVLTVSNDHKAILWDVNSGNPIYERIQLQKNNWLVKLPNSPYYMCSKDASKMLHYVTPSLKVIGFEQLDPVYNRPDIVLDSIGKYFGNSDGGMIDEYRKSWEKRIDRLGLDKEKLSKGEIAVPSAEIVGANAIAYDNKSGILNITVSANDAKYPLRRFNVFVNEVPLYGSTGISIAHLKKQLWETTVSVPLSIGENKIQVSVMNELGLENFKYPTYVNYTPEKEIVAKTHYIGIGVNEFKDTEHNLKYCVKDVTDLAKSFGGANTEVTLFTDQQVTKENILALKDYLNKTNVNDKVIISCSSHGLLDDSLNFYLAMHDVDFNNPKARGLKYEELENLLDSIPARQKLLLLDACNSGENDKTEVFKNELANNHNKMDSTQILAARGVIIKLEDENKSNFKKMNELFVNVRNNTGSVIISAAGGKESAFEAIFVDGKIIENGAFSFCVLEYLKNNSNKPEELTVNKLKNYVEKRVEEITNGDQKPTSRQETMEVDWRLR